MPRGETYGYRCEKCPRPEGTRAVLVGDFASEAEAIRELSVHAAVQHPTPSLNVNNRFTTARQLKKPAKTARATN
jgi:hypothetical protein